MAENIPNPKSYEEILSVLLNSYATRTGTSDMQVGSAVTSLFETVALMTARTSGDIFQILKDFSVDRATGDALKRLAVENGVTPLSAKPATSTVTITDLSFIKKSTKIYAGLNPPNVGTVSLAVSDASQFTGSGNIYIGRGTPNIEGPIPYSSITPTGGYYVITLSSPTTKFHNIGESVILAQGGNRTVPANTLVLSPAVGASSDIVYSVTTQAIILDGEVTVTNVPVTAQLPGAAGNVPRGAIRTFGANPPGLGNASVTNPLPVTTGTDSETDDQLRIRIKRALASKGLGTATAIKASAIGASPSDETSTVVSDELINTSSGAILYVDDGTGYEAKTAGIGLETIVDQALGGEKFFQLSTGGRQAPVAKAFLISSLAAPYDLIGGDTLAITVGERTYEHVFSNTDFRSPGGATPYEITASINANTALGFEAATSGGKQYVVLRTKTESGDTIKTSVPTTSGRDAAAQIGFSSSESQTLRLFKNKKPLSKDGVTASVFTLNQSSWSNTISDGDTLIVSIDNTAPITYTVNDADFIATGLYPSVSSSNSLASWSQVLTKKITGATVTVIGQQLKIISNLGANNSASVSINSSSMLVVKGMFSTLALSATGKTSDYMLSRNTAQIELTDPLLANDSLVAGNDETEAVILSDAISGGTITFASDAYFWMLIDSAGKIIPTGVASSTLVSVSKPSTNVVRYTSNIANAFSNVQVGDYVIVWSTELSSGNRLEGRVNAVTSTTLDILVTAAEYALAVVETSIVFVSGFVILRSDNVPQKFKIASGVTKSLETIAQEIQSQSTGIKVNVLQDTVIKIKTKTKDTTGSLLVVTTDAIGVLLKLPVNSIAISQEALIAFYDSGEFEGRLPLFIHAGFAAGSAADPINSYITSLTSSLNLSGRDPNELICIINPYGTSKDAQASKERVQEKSISGATVTIDNQPNIRRLRTVDRYYLGNPLDFGSQDTSVVVLDNDSSGKNFEIPFYRKAQTNTTFAISATSFNAYDIDTGAGASFNSPNTFQGFDFSNFKVLMQAKKVLKHTAAQTALLYRSVKWGRSGEKITVGYDYPSAAGAAISSVVSVNNTTDIRISLKSGGAIGSSIDGTTEWNITITPNTPIAGIDQVTYTWNTTGTAPALTLSGGEYVNIGSQTEFNISNTGIFRVSTQAGFTPTSTSFSVQRANGAAIAESNKATLVTGSISFYQASATTAADINAYVNSNLSNYISSTITNDGGMSGSGIINLSTFEDSGFIYDRKTLLDGINWIASSNIAGTPQFTFKNSLNLPSDIGYEFRNSEEIRIIPTTIDQTRRLHSILAVTGFTTVGTINPVDRGSRLELSTNILGSDGSIQIIGGTANSYQVPVYIVINGLDLILLFPREKKLYLDRQLMPLYSPTLL
jgi:uncharacterized phage protein gp47/JayE